MKNMIRNCSFIICCYLLLVGAYCKAGTDSPTAVIDIVVHDDELLNDAVLEFELYKDGVNSRYVKDVQYSRTVLQESVTRFTLPLSTWVNYGRIVYTSGEMREINSPVNLNYGNNLFLFEQGDTIQVHLYPKKIKDVVFTGNRAGKYEALYKINNKKKVDSQTHGVTNDLFMRNKGRSALKVMEVWADSLTRALDRILIETDGSLNPAIKERILFDNSAYVYNVIRTKMDRLVRTNESDTDVLQMVHSFLSKPIFDHRSLLNEPVSALSYEWCDMLLFNERLRSKVKHLLANEPSRKGESIGETLSERYTGQIRNKLYYLALLRNLDADGMIRNALEDKSDKTDYDCYRKAATAFLGRSEGSLAYNFEMVDSKGIMHRLSDYKGKVLIIDFWFSGCMACMYLAKEMREAVEYYEDSDDVVFVSLNFDRYPDYWQRSLASAKYTHETGLNLWAGEIATKHPIIGHYGIQGYPMLLIVDKNGVLVERHVNRLFAVEDPWATDKFKTMVNQYR